METTANERKVRSVRISRIRLKNWRNFAAAEVGDLPDVVYLLGPNASGKSNFLDALRFLRDVAKSEAGGLQGAVKKRGDVGAIRCLHARSKPQIEIEVDLTEADGSGWTYLLSFDGKNPRIKEEVVSKRSANGETETVLRRPDADDEEDAERLQETHLEQINSNKNFREIANFLSKIQYLHLVPQLIKFSDQISGNIVEDDPFGQNFLQIISKSQERTRKARLRRISNSLERIAPQITELEFVKDDVSGKPHLQINFQHHRPRGAKQRETQFSDGTLRLIALLWALQDADAAPLLLEEPELSLNEEIVKQIPLVIDRVRRRSRKTASQVFLSTHSASMLDNPGIDRRGLVIVVPSNEGATLEKPTEDENAALDAGLTPAEVVLRRAGRDDQLPLFALE